MGISWCGLGGVGIGHCYGYMILDTVMATWLWTMLQLHGFGHCYGYMALDTVTATWLWTLLRLHDIVLVPLGQHEQTCFCHSIGCSL